MGISTKRKTQETTCTQLWFVLIQNSRWFKHSLQYLCRKYSPWRMLLQGLNLGPSRGLSTRTELRIVVVLSFLHVRPTDLLCDLAFKHIPAQVVAHVGSIYAGFCRFAFLYPWLYLNSWRVENTVFGLDLCFLYCVIHPSFMNLLTETDELRSLLHIIMQVTGYKPSCWAVGMSLGFLVLPPGMSWKGQPYLAQTWYL